VPVAMRAGMLSARQSAIIRCVKSRQTPTRSISVSTADVLALLVLDANVTCFCTQCWIASTRL
jgi:hypothetical protein